MNRSLITLAGLSLVTIGVVACGGTGNIDGTDETAGRDTTAPVDPIASHTDALAWRARSRTLVRAPAPTQAPVSHAAPTPTPAATSAADAVASAQTADGRAIPQSSLPGGACPAVVAAVGFWSCVTLGDQCTYSSGGVSHSCTCSRVDGEGQAPEWLCN
jgi:hypothetical protein